MGCGAARLGMGEGWASDLARKAAPDPKGDKATAGFRSGPGPRHVQVPVQVW